MRAAAVSYSLSLLVAGRYQRKARPAVRAGQHGRGRESFAVGDAVHRIRPGDRVLASLEFGALAERAVAHHDNVYPLPATMPFAPRPPPTAPTTRWRQPDLSHLLAIEPGQTLLVTGATGAWASPRSSWAARSGRRSSRPATGPTSAFAAQLGAHHVVQAHPDTLRDDVLRAWTAACRSGHRVRRRPAVRSGAALPGARRACCPSVRRGQIPQIPANLLLVKNITVCGLYMGTLQDRSAGGRPACRPCSSAWAGGGDDGSIRPVIAGRYPLDQVPAAFAQVLGRATSGGRHRAGRIPTGIDFMRRTAAGEKAP